MEAELEQIREQQKETWNKFSAGWKKWDKEAMRFLGPFGDALVESLKVKETDYILDIASGTGEPGLTLAQLASKGKVILSDLAEDMLVTAKEKAKQKGITNIEIITADVSKLPFEDNTFDAVSCRFGFMFFPDMQEAANEIARVLKPGGRAATTVWNIPEKNQFATVTGMAIKNHIQIPDPPPGAPGLFRCCEKGLISGLFKNAGLKNAAEKEIDSFAVYSSVDEYWNLTVDVAAPVSAALSQTDEETRENVKNEVYERLTPYLNKEGELCLSSSALLITAEK